MFTPFTYEFDSNKSWIYTTNCCTIFILDHVAPCVYAIGFKGTTMLAYIYNRHSIAYDPIYRGPRTTCGFFARKWRKLIYI